MKTPKEIYLLQKGSQLLGTWSRTPQMEISGGWYSAEYKYIRADLIKQQEQPEVDLEKFDKEVTKIWGKCAADPNDSIACLHIETFNEIARHFYELGLNARKEESK